jgi:hypothetical protein
LRISLRTRDINKSNIAAPEIHADYSDMGTSFSSVSLLSFSTEAALSPTGTLTTGTSTSITVTDMTYSQDSSYTFDDDSYQYNTPQVFTGFIGNTALAQAVDLTCSVGGLLSISYTLTSASSSSVPSWISLDETNSQLVGTTPSLSADTTFVFNIEASSSAWSSNYVSQISLTISKCL